MSINAINISINLEAGFVGYSNILKLEKSPLLHVQRKRGLFSSFKILL